MRRRVGAERARVSRLLALPHPHSPSPPLHTTAHFSTSSRERVLIIGGGISGLTTAYFLQHLPSSPTRPPPLLHVVDSSPRLGGWIHTVHPHVLSSSGAPLPFLLELGPRSLLTRRGDSTLTLLQSLHLHADVLLSSPTSKHRYVWNGHTRRLVELPTGLNGTLLSFPYLSPVVSALWNEWRQPMRGGADESIYDFVSRRFSRFVAEELVDPLVAGIYSGDIHQLSVASCFPTLHTAETQHGGVLRGLIRGRQKPHAAAAVDGRMEGEAELDGKDWVEKVKANGTYSFNDGMEVLPKALIDAIESRAKATSSHVGRPPVLRTTAPVQRLAFSERGVTAIIDGREENYDRVISTSSSLALGRILQHSELHAIDTTPPPSPLTPSPPQVDTTVGGGLHVLSRSSMLPSSSLLSSLSSSLLSLPHASVYVVNLGYDSAILPQPGFGVLCSSLHSSDILGIAFDSSCFPSQPPAIPSTTRLTVMLGGARFPHIAEETWEQAVERAMRGVERMLGCSLPPVYVGGGLMKECIPQYVVGHGGWVKGVEEGVAEVNQRVGRQQLQVIGNGMYGMSVNDLITGAKRTAMQYYQS